MMDSEWVGRYLTNGWSLQIACRQHGMGPKPEWGENRVMRLANPARSWSPLLFPLNFVVKQRTCENGSETIAHVQFTSHIVSEPNGVKCATIDR